MKETEIVTEKEKVLSKKEIEKQKLDLKLKRKREKLA